MSESTADVMVFWVMVILVAIVLFKVMVPSSADRSEAVCQAKFGMGCAEAKRDSDRMLNDTLKQYD